MQSEHEMRRLPTPEEIELVERFKENQSKRRKAHTIDIDKISSGFVIFNIQKQVLEKEHVHVVAQAKLGLLKRECETLGHLIAPSWAREHERLGGGDFGGAHCLICLESFGWYCPDSPDHLCHYEDKPYPKTGSPEICIYCGYPGERK